jgi:3-dehydroquinate synthase
MPTITLSLPHHRYDILVEPGALNKLGGHLRHLAPNHKAGLVVDTGAAAHGDGAQASLAAAGYGVTRSAYAASEENKNLTAVGRILNDMLEARCERGTPVVSVGGGITGDVAGFAAAACLRGVPFVQCPTTLLAMVDASVGGKTGVNAAQGKNLIGAFHQPVLVVCDIATLDTLPGRELRCGLAECVKHGIIRDPSLFAWMETRAAAILGRDHGLLAELVARNVAIKARVVEADEKETGERAHLNFGHTFAHAIENVAGYTTDFKHGEAVALGMVAATRLSVDAGRCEPALLDRLEKLLAALELPVRWPAGKALPTDTLMAAMGSDKKVKDGQVRLILPDGMGKVSIVKDTPRAAVEAAWGALV